MNRRIRTCYISAVAGTRLEVLRQVLASRNIDVLAPHIFDTGLDWRATNQKHLMAADLVIGILTPERNSQWVLFELGEARALGREILLLVPPSIPDVPSSTQGFLVLRASLYNREALEFALDQLIAAPYPSTSLHQTKFHEQRALGAMADSLLREMRDMLARGNSQELEKLVANAIRLSGVEVVVANPRASKRVDLAVWSDALGPYVGNPFLIEIKKALFSYSHAVETIRALRRTLEASGSSWGLLLFGDGPPLGGPLGKPRPPHVLISSIPNLLQRMRTQSFSEVVRELRDSQVFGVGTK